MDLDFLLDSHCSISLCLYRISLLSFDVTNSAADVDRREQLRDELDRWLAALPTLGCYAERVHRYYHYLRYRGSVCILGTILLTVLPDHSTLLEAFYLSDASDL